MRKELDIAAVRRRFALAVILAAAGFAAVAAAVELAL
jgi:hypothetical protein